MTRLRTSYYVINGITMYRFVSAPLLLVLLMAGEELLFRWLILFSFLTDVIDGPLSRKFKVTSVFGSRLDSVADDATVFVSTIALWIVQPDFVRGNWVVLTGLLALFLIQTVAALIAYKKVTSFHTYMAKAAAVMQAIFFLSFFFNFQFAHIFFLFAASVTAIQLIEEILLVIIVPEWEADVKGVYWAWRSRRGNVQSRY